MFAHLRRNAVAYLALFVALGGTGYAQLGLRPNSIHSVMIAQGAVKSSDIANGGVKSPDIGRGEVKRSDLGRNAVGSGNIANGAIAPQDLAPQVRQSIPGFGLGGGALPGIQQVIGAQGAQGAPGANGAQGEQGVEGPPGPTEGGATDAGGTFVSEGSVAPVDFTTERAGRVFVARLVQDLQLDCSSGSDWAMWLEVDGDRVPGSYITAVPDSTPVETVTLHGVTPDALPAGTHESLIAFDCLTGSYDTVSSAEVEAVSFIVLG